MRHDTAEKLRCCAVAGAIAVGALSVCATLFAAENTANAELAQSKAAEHFERVIRPILEENCTVCHGEDTQEAELRLDLPNQLLGASGAGALVVPHDPDQSRLIQLVRGTAEIQMPPDDRLSPEAIAALEQWVRDGVIWPGYEEELLPGAASRASGRWQLASNSNRQFHSRPARVRWHSAILVCR
jgi:hypothetical protein